MAAPNLNAVSLVVNAAVDRITPGSTLEQSLTVNAAASGHTFITLSLTAANNTTGGIEVRANYFDGTNVNSIGDFIVPGMSTIEMTPTRKALLEGWTLKVTTPNTTSGITFVHTYLDCH
jgi:hypothetical protein